MTNKELQEALKQYPDDAEVVFGGVLFDYGIREIYYHWPLKKIKLED